MDKKKSGLKESTKWLMLGVALFFDALQWLLGFIVMDWTVGIVAPMTFFLWFKLAGQKLSMRHAMSLGGGTMLEVIPVVGTILPTWTAAILYLTRAEKVISEVAGTVPGGKVVSSVVTGKK